MARIAGEVLPLWASYWASNEYLRGRGEVRCLFFKICFTLFKHFVPEISAARASAEWSDDRPFLVKACKSEEEADCLIELLRSMLVIDPAERPSVCQVMESHRWLVEPNNVV
jgi:hypothetical protein